LSAPFVLVSEARGEFLMVERIRAELERLGRPAVHVTPHADDVTELEQRETGAVVLERHPEYRRAAALSAAALREAVDEEQDSLGVNLRRLWRADLRCWREGYPDEAMARITIGSLRAWREVLGGLGEVAGLWGEDGGHLAKRAAFTLAEAGRTVPLVFVYVSPLPGRLLVLDNALNLYDPQAFADVVVTDDDRDYAAEVLEDVRASRVQFAVPRDLSFRLARVVRFAGLVGDRYVRRAPGARSLYPFGFARAYARQRAGRAVLRLSYRQLGPRPFVFHPIHAGFDAQISVRAPQWENQLALVEHVASSLPYGYELAIKEHPFEVGALPTSRLVSLLRRRPEIRLLDPTIHAHRILPRCAAVTTINSTTGFEALFFGRPLVTFGNGPYRGLGLTTDVHDPFDTPRALLRALTEPPPSEEDVTRLVTFLHRRSRPGRSLAYDVSNANITRHAELLAEFAERRAPALAAG
jgi:hypothetical protein